MSTPRILIGLLVGLAAGCGPSAGALRTALDKGAYDRAVAIASDDAALQIELAALVLEDAAARDDSRFDLVDILARAGAPGKRALKRLSAHPGAAAGRLASVMLRGKRVPDRQTLARFLEDESADVRAAAAEAWAFRLDLSRLGRLALDIDPRVRRAAVVGLAGNRGDGGNSALLKEALRLDPDPKVRAAAARRGRALGADGLSALRSALSDGNLGVRLAALEGLSDLGDAAATRILEDYATGPLDEIAVAASAELARKGAALGRERLLDALVDDRPGLRIAAMMLLERAGFPEREKQLAGMLGDRSPLVRLQAAMLLSEKEAWRGPVIEALGKLSGEHALYAEKARNLLARLGDKQAIVETAELLRGGDKALVLRTIPALGRAKALWGDFVRLLASADPEVRIAAARAVILAA